MELSVDLWHVNNMKVISTLWTLMYGDSVPFFCIGSFHIVHNLTLEANFLIMSRLMKLNGSLSLLNILHKNLEQSHNLRQSVDINSV